MPVPCLRQAYEPVSNENLDGVQVADVACTLVKFTPLAASLSICGVLIAAVPLLLISPKPTSSVYIKTIFGFVTFIF
jgi:hypothetical protein